LFFFFFKQKTAYEINAGDWSSDVCSSDLFRMKMRQPAEEDRENDHRRERLQHRPERAENGLPIADRDIAHGDLQCELPVAPKLGRRKNPTEASRGLQPDRADFAAHVARFRVSVNCRRLLGDPIHSQRIGAAS